MTQSASKLALLGFGLTISLAAVCRAGEAPKILVTSFQVAVPATSSQVQGPSVQGFEARFAAQFEAAAGGRAVAVLDATRRSGAGLEANEIRSLADEAGAAFVLVGEWQRAEASPASSDDLEAAIELRSGHSGATEHRYRLTWDSSVAGAADAEIGRVARAMLDDLNLSPETTEIARVGASAGVRSSPPETSRERGKRTDFLTVSRDQPIQINSEELELLTEGNAKHLIFSDHVRVVQGKMSLSAGHLEAFYPDGASQPERLHAKENVHLVEGNLEVYCREAIYLRAEGLVICRGNALLVQGCDELRGDEIVFDLDEERVKIRGAASVVLHLDRDDPSDCRSGGGTG